jgi:hypothetical protein
VTAGARVGASVAALALAAPPSILGPFGRGADAVWLLRPRGPVRSVVVFGHGWKLAPPSATAPWVGQFRPWLDHLVAAGNAVVFPRYQLGVRDAPGASVAASFRRGLHTGFAHLHAGPVPVVAAGYSYGASLALAYAANAARWRLPPVAAVDAVFPAGPIPGVPLPPLPRSVRVLVEVGDEDAVAGSAGADAFWRWLRTHPRTRKTYRVVRSTRTFRATHAAPKSPAPAARRSFWYPLDALVADARSGA